jgi:L-aspartate oxidase
MVFGARVVERITSGHDGPTSTGAMRAQRGGVDAPDVIGGRPVTTGLLPASRGVAPSQPSAPPARPGAMADWSKARDRLQVACTAGAGVVRTAASLADAEDVLDELLATADEASRHGRPAPGELVNLLTLGRALLRSATARAESRGAHSRADFPRTSAQWRCRLVHRGRAA